MTRPLPRQPRGRAPVLVLLTVVVLAVTAVASARTTAVPTNTAPPTTSGSAHEGQMLFASFGAWDNSPSRFAYRWQRCGANGTGCADIATATRGKYMLTVADVGHTVRVSVTASNEDGKAAASSQATDVVSAKSAPGNTAGPSITGTAKVGEEVTADTGTWTAGAGSLSVQWQRCNLSGVVCADIAGATGRTYGVGSADVGKTLRAVVTASNAAGSTSAASDLTLPVTALPAQGIKAPTIVFFSLKRAGARVYARFRVCDDSGVAVVITERDTKARALSFTRWFSVTPLPCSTQSRGWVPAARFRSRGRYVVTLRVADKSGALSPLVSRSLTF